MDAVKETADSNNVQVAMGFGYGLRTGTPIAVGYIPSAVACGILCKTAGLTAFESLFMSLVVFAGASQFVALNLIMIGSSFPEIVLATAVLNMRHIMMSSSLARRLVPGIGALKKSWICFELTDESFSIASMQKEPRLAPEFMFGLNIVGHISWVSGTLLGFYGTSVMPQNVQDSMGIALYALFLGLLLPSVRKSRPAFVVAAAGMALSALIKWTPYFAGLNRGIAIMTATGIAALIGALLFPLDKRRSAR
ncbi:MAG TPA: branched-chain amino acid ABC transporter permease [Synergistaceae bacterium]|jgi:4-azaleucine resistance transporter AzlC|uniref:AzlC family ABC transporter permease n=1 Tax=Synergistaceae TaxID=649777 RepID=UPI000EBC9120|nr:AzlC family ABC transporter permease [Synergistaceae bacterium DZ-S4]HAH68530.1 branched-chain amino acid ABC transporter permease [Synergistaceae bacterium]